MVRAYRFVRSLPAQARGEGGFISRELFSGIYKYAGGAAVAGMVAGGYYIRWEIVQFIVDHADVFRMYAAYAFEQSLGFNPDSQIDWAGRTEGRGNAGQTAASFFHPSGPSGFSHLIPPQSLI